MNKNIYQIRKYHHGSSNIISGTIKELTEYFGYTLECGKSWEHEKGNHKISLHPRTIESLVNNVNNAYYNKGRNRYSHDYIELV